MVQSQLEFSHLRLENQRLAEQCRRYRHERRRWTDWLKRRQGPTAAKEVDGQRLVEEALTELELMVSEYREENSALKSELDRVRVSEKKRGKYLEVYSFLSGSRLVRLRGHPEWAQRPAVGGTSTHS
jgi:hypothetical protein